jgi:DNA-directed RNA polymerase specialized sigma24 family protein
MPAVPRRVRDDGLTAEQRQLVERTRVLAAEIEMLQQRMIVVAGQRAQSVAALHATGLSIRRIADALGTSTGPVETALARARRRREADQGGEAAAMRAS